MLNCDCLSRIKENNLNVITSLFDLMSDPTVEKTTSPFFSHERDGDSEGGRITVNPPDSQTSRDKFFVACSDPRDTWSEVPGPISQRTRRKLAQARENSHGKQVTVSAEIHHNSDEDSSEEDDGRYEIPISKRSSRMDKQHQQGDAGNGTHATKLLSR